MKTTHALPLLATAVLLTLAPSLTQAQRPFDPANLPVAQATIPPTDPAFSRRPAGQDPYQNRPYDDRPNQNRPYNGPYDAQPGYDRSGRGNAPYNGRGFFDYDRARTEMQIGRLDAIVGLTRFQAKQLRRLDDIYDREFALAPRRPDAYQRLQQRKAQDVLSILTPLQRDRLFADQYYRQYRGGSYSRNDNGRGNGNDWGNRRW